MLADLEHFTEAALDAIVDAARFRMALEIISDLAPHGDEIGMRVAKVALREDALKALEQRILGGAGEGAGVTPEPRGDVDAGAADHGQADDAGAPPRAADGESATGDGRPAEAAATAAATEEKPRRDEVAPVAPRAADRPKPETRTYRTQTQRIEDLITALRDGPRSTTELAEALGVSQSRIEDLTGLLVDRGTIVRLGKARSRTDPTRWALKVQADAQVARIGTGRPGTPREVSTAIAKRRADVLACIREGAGLVDEPEIAEQLGMDREHVAEATGALLEAGTVERQHDGTYIVSEEARAA